MWASNMKQGRMINDNNQLFGKQAKVAPDGTHQRSESDQIISIKMALIGASMRNRYECPNYA
jgi:hypothetical protein